MKQRSWTIVVGSAPTPAQLQPLVAMMAQGVTGGERCQHNQPFLRRTERPSVNQIQAFAGLKNALGRENFQHPYLAPAEVGIRPVQIGTTFNVS